MTHETFDKSENHRPKKSSATFAYNNKKAKAVHKKSGNKTHDKQLSSGRITVDE